VNGVRYLVVGRDGSPLTYISQPLPRRRTALSPWFDLLRGLNTVSCHRVAGLIRLASALTDHRMPGRVSDGGAVLDVQEAGEALWRAIQRRDDGREGYDAVRWAERVLRACITPVIEALIPRPTEARQEVDPRPGCYYVSACDGGSRVDANDVRRWLVAGPYATHAEALGLVSQVRAHSCHLDPRGVWLAWGTARSEEPIASLLGEWRPAAPASAHAPAKKTSNWKRCNRRELRPVDDDTDDAEMVVRHR
jgi:hypothetical protein